MSIVPSDRFAVPTDQDHWFERLVDGNGEGASATATRATPPRAKRTGAQPILVRRRSEASMPVPTDASGVSPASAPPIELGIAAGRVLLVASGGGHFTQLQELTRRLQPQPLTIQWCTYDSPQAHSLLGDQDWIAGHGPSTRSLKNAARNLRLARRLLRSGEIDAVISTGAGIAVPFLGEAARRGIPAHYIESATRIHGPSMSGRMVERFDGVTRWHQYAGADWGARWGHAGAVFDGFRAVAGPDREIRRVFVSLGTHGFAFDRAVSEVCSVVDPRAEIVWQLGSTQAPVGLRGSVHESLEPDAHTEAMENADVVIAHAGTGVALDAIRAGKLPVLLPREARLGEHVDDHQIELATRLADAGLAVTPLTHRLTRDELRRAASTRVARSELAA